MPSSWKSERCSFVGRIISLHLDDSTPSSLSTNADEQTKQDGIYIIGNMVYRTPEIGPGRQMCVFIIWVFKKAQLEY